jgi:serine/threonine protein kinase/lipopolysaccharide biosynthesis regulator YciM
MIDSRYETVRVLGKGGWGEVNLAIHTSTGKQVAIKRIRLSEIITAASVNKEIESLSKLDHPGVVKYIESIVEGDCIYVVMEYVEGETLEQMQEKGSLPLSQIQRYTFQLAEALEHIHSEGIIHSDLKPENIIIDKNDNIRIIDFGIVRTASAEIASDIKEVRGTLHYMSPEQAEGNPIDIRSDLFSLGVILYELCCGTKPFSGDYDMAVIYAILYEEPAPPDKVNEKVSPGLSQAIIKLLAKTPSERPTSATQVCGLLPEEFAADSTAQPGVHRMAVLPFEFPSDDDDSRLIADGLKDELYTRLKSLKDLEIVSPIKVSRHLENLTDGRAIRTHLGADDYLTGTVRRIASQIRIYLMLISSSDDTVVWSDKFDNPITDLFEVIDHITEQVVEKVKTEIMGQTKISIPASSTTHPEARKMFLEALKLDPDYALARVGIADCYCAEYMYSINRSDEAIKRATEWAQKALEIVPNLPEAYRTMGRIMQTTGRIKEAGDYFLKAATYKEDYYLAYRSLGWLSKDCYKYDEALNWIRKTLSINSTDLETIYLKGVIHYERKESKQAINDFTRCLELRPDYGRAFSFMGMTYFQLGWVNDAIESLQQAIQFGGDINVPYLLGYYYLCEGAYGKSISTLMKATTKPEISFLAWLYLGVAKLLVNQTDGIDECFIAARNDSQDLVQEIPDLHLAKAVLASSLAFLGDKEQSRKLIKDMVPFTSNDGSLSLDIARIYAIMGEEELSRQYIDMAVETFQGPTLAEIELDPILNHFSKKGK